MAKDDNGMIGDLAKNLWFLLTLVIPGLVTYGTFRLLLFMDGVDANLAGRLDKLDDSTFLAVSVVLAIALSQQAIAISIEALLAAIAVRFKDRAPQFHELVCERFKLAAKGKMSEDATRITGNFFLSMNVTVGLLLILAFFLGYEHKPLLSPVPLILEGLSLAGLISTVYRFFNAKWAIHSIATGAAHADATARKES
jgi:hypothetical protein